MQINNIDDALLAVNAYHGTYKSALASGKSDKEALQASTHQRNYALLGEASGICNALLTNPEILAQLLTTFGITAAREGQNEFGPLVRALFRHKKGGGTVWNKSTWKFGNILRFIRDEGWKQNEIADRLSELKVTIDGTEYTKLKAAEMADRAKYSHEDADARRTNDLALQYLLEGEGIGVVAGDSIEVEGKADGCLVTLAASWSAKQGNWIIRAVDVTNSDAVARAIMPKALKAYEAGTIELLKRTARQHVDVAAANLTAGEKRMFAEMQIGDFVWPIPVPNAAKANSKAKAKGEANAVVA